MINEKEKLQSLKGAIEIISTYDDDISVKKMSELRVDNMQEKVDDELMKLLINQNYNDLADLSLNKGNIKKR